MTLALAACGSDGTNQRMECEPTDLTFTDQCGDVAAARCCGDADCDDYERCFSTAVNKLCGPGVDLDACSADAVECRAGNNSPYYTDACRPVASCEIAADDLYVRDTMCDLEVVTGVPQNQIAWRKCDAARLYEGCEALRVELVQCWDAITPDTCESCVAQYQALDVCVP